jgi:hypothetical protein
VLFNVLSWFRKQEHFGVSDEEMKRRCKKQSEKQRNRSKEKNLEQAAKRMRNSKSVLSELPVGMDLSLVRSPVKEQGKTEAWKESISTTKKAQGKPTARTRGSPVFLTWNRAHPAATMTPQERKARTLPTDGPFLVQYTVTMAGDPL